MNQHIKDFLNYYKTLESPKYAVLLKGEWGTGKTFFIDNVIKNDPDSYIKISLYGLKSTDEIIKALFLNLNPILNTKALKIFGTVFNSVIKSTLKLDLGEFVNLDVNSTTRNPKIDEGFLINITKKIIVFDDLERCKTDILELIGLINQLVENLEAKIILIGNIDKLNNSEKFQEIKEKTIGKEFEIGVDYKSAITFFISKVDSKHILSENSDKLIQIFEESGFRNLRVLNQTVFDFDRFWKEIYISEFGEKKDLIAHLVQLYFISSLEVKNNILNKDTIDSLFTSFTYRELDASSDVKLNSKDKYSFFLSNYEHPISSELIASCLIDSNIKREDIHKYIKGSSYYFNESIPSFIKLKHFPYLEDDQFVKCYDETINSLINGEEYGIELIEIANILYNIYRCDLSEKALPDVKLLIQNNFIKRDNDFLKGLNVSMLENIYNTYNENFKKEFNDLYSLIIEKIINAKSEDLKNNANTKLELLSSNPDDFFNSVIQIDNKSNESEIYFLSYFDKELFLKKILALKPNDIITLTNYFEERYKKGVLKEDIGMLEFLKIELEIYVQNFERKTPRIFQLEKGLLRLIEKCLENKKGGI